MNTRKNRVPSNKCSYTARDSLRDLTFVYPTPFCSITCLHCLSVRANITCLNKVPAYCCVFYIIDIFTLVISLRLLTAQCVCVKSYSQKPFLYTRANFTSVSQKVHVNTYGVYTYSLPPIVQCIYVLSQLACSSSSQIQHPLPCGVAYKQLFA